MNTPCDPFLANADSFQTLHLSGTDNFRSLIGMPTASGQRIAGHAILRSDQLHQLDENAWLTLKKLGVKTVCDLRSLGERERYPNRLPEYGLRQLILEVIADVRADPGFVEQLAENPSAENAENMMLDIYRRFPAMLAPHLPALFGLFESGDVPVLIHCAAGKDRTGFAVAMLLHGFGVSQADIIADYQRSGRRFADLDPVRQEAWPMAYFGWQSNRSVRQRWIRYWMRDRPTCWRPSTASAASMARPISTCRSTPVLVKSVWRDCAPAAYAPG